MARHWLIEDLTVGQSFSWRRAIAAGDIEATIRLTGDQGGYHVDEAFALKAGFRTIIAPGMLQAGLVTKLGGDLNLLAREVAFTFVKPVYAGDVLDVTLKVVAIERDKRRLTFEGAIANQHGEQVLTFHTSGTLPRPEWGVPVKPGPD